MLDFLEDDFCSLYRYALSCKVAHACNYTEYQDSDADQSAAKNGCDITSESSSQGTFEEFECEPEFQ